MSLEITASGSEDEEFIDELKPDTKLMLGQYVIEDFLAAGGMGITYLAKDSLNRRVVIKECFPGSVCRRQNSSVLPRSRAHHNELKSIVRLFSQEAMSLAKANHPNIVGVHQVWEENNTAYMALDYVQGRDLLEILLDAPDSLKPDLVEGYLIKMLDAIKHIHGLGILHRDISPDNIIINEVDEPILIDFGAARESTNEHVTRMLSALRVVKDGYSPQEFYIAGSDQSFSCDLYSLAASFYHVITQELPPDSQLRLSACASGDGDPYVSLGKKTDAYSKRFVGGLDKALSVLPRDRMQSAEEWLRFISKRATRADLAPPVKPTRHIAPQSPRRMPVLPIVLAVAGVAVVAGIGRMYLMPESSEVQGVTPPVFSTTMDAPDQPIFQDAEPLGIDIAISGSGEGPLSRRTAPTLEEASTLPVSALPVLGTPEIFGVEQFSKIIGAFPPPPIEEPDAIAPSSTASPEIPITPGVFPRAEPEASQPSVDTSAPAAPAPSPAESEGPAAPDDTLEIGPEFFMAMAEKNGVAPRTSPKGQYAATRPDGPSSLSASEPGMTPIMARDLPTLPFSLSAFSPGLIVDVSNAAPEWITENSRIVSVNGTAVNSSEEIETRLAELGAQSDSETLEVTLGIQSREDGSTFERSLSLVKEKHFLLLNGLHFVARKNGPSWTTEVAAAPPSSNFRPGDKLVSYVATWETLDGPISLQTIVERELKNGISSFNFAVSRDGEIWIEVFNLASLGN